MSNSLGGWLVKNHGFLYAGALVALSCALESATPNDGIGQSGNAGATSGQGGLGNGGSAPGGKAGIGGLAGSGGASGGATSGGTGGGSGRNGAGRAGSGGEEAVAGSAGEAGAGGEGGTPDDPDATCASEPCENGASCADVDGGFECTCLSGYEGTRCETDIDDCADEPCLNGGDCVDGVDSYTCDCRTGYDGDTCENDIDDCLGVSCQNGGSCVDGVATYTCACTSRYTGPVCEYLEIKLVGTDFYLGDQTRVTALSNDGNVALLNVRGDGGEWVAKLVDFESVVAVELTGLQSSGRWGFGISADGGVIAGQVALGGPTYVPFKLVGNAATLLDLDPLPAPNSGSNALDVSADGTTIVGVSNDSQTGKLEAFRYTAAGSRYVGNWLANESMQKAHAVSGDGSVVAGVATGANSLPVRAWRWSGGVTTTLEMKAASWTQPGVNDISRNGQVIVGSALVNGVSRAVRWTGSAGTAEDLGTGVAFGTNADGSVTVGSDNSGNAVVWIGTSKQTLSSVLGSNPDIVGSLAVAIGVSDDGKVVAGHLIADGKDQGFMARLP